MKFLQENDTLTGLKQKQNISAWLELVFVKQRYSFDRNINFKSADYKIWIQFTKYI